MIGPLGMRICDLATAKPCLVSSCGDVGIGDGAEQAAIHTGFLCQLDGGAAELFALRLHFGQLGSSGFFEFGAS